MSLTLRCLENSLLGRYLLSYQSRLQCSSPSALEGENRAAATPRLVLWGRGQGTTTLKYLEARILRIAYILGTKLVVSIVFIKIHPSTELPHHHILRSDFFIHLFLCLVVASLRCLGLFKSLLTEPKNDSCRRLESKSYEATEA